MDNSKVSSDDLNKSSSPAISNESIKRKIPTKKSSQRGGGGDDSSTKGSEHMPTDMSDSSDSDQSKSIPFVSTTECTSLHEGRQLVHAILPIKVDVLFDMLFSKSKFLQEFHAGRRTTDLVHGNWVENEEGIKTRKVTLTIALTGIGPKNAAVTENQKMRECSKVGELYSIDIQSTNAGIPYADSFEVHLHYCLVKTVDDHTMLSVHAQIQYNKKIWGPVKGFIEKNTWAGLEDFYSSLGRALQNEYCIPPAKAKSRRRGKRGSTLTSKPNDEITSSSITTEIVTTKILSAVTGRQITSNPYKRLSIFVIILLIILFIFNIILLMRLYKLEKLDYFNFPNLKLNNIGFGGIGSSGGDITSGKNIPNFANVKNLPNNHNDWIKLLQQQELLHETEMEKWHKILETAIELLNKVNNVCQTLIKNDYNAGSQNVDDESMKKFSEEL